MEPHSGAILAAGKVGVGPMVIAERYTGLACDSRKVEPGFLFAALPGTRADGTAFIVDAVRRGAVAVLGVPQARRLVESMGAVFIADDNPRLRLAGIAADYFGAQPEIIAAVTGTNGKTSVSVFCVRSGRRSDTKPPAWEPSASFLRQARPGLNTPHPILSPFTKYSRV
jgi:UDP-N-acetylmuramyl tripeptide synthase